MTQKPEDIRSDEVLVELYHQFDDQSAVETLITRYQTRLWDSTIKLSFYKDKSFIDDIVQVVFYTIFRLIKDNRFAPQGTGSFKAWVSNMARKITFNENQRRMRREKTITDTYPEPFNEEMTARRVSSSSRTVDDEKYLARLQEAIAQLEPLDQKLLQLRQADMPYDQILIEPEFINYKKSGRLRMRYCRILEFLRRYLKKE